LRVVASEGRWQHRVAEPETSTLKQWLETTFEKRDFSRVVFRGVPKIIVAIFSRNRRDRQLGSGRAYEQSDTDVSRDIAVHHRDDRFRHQ
jgi:hypothetical protein